jgi:hypothetical protein
VDFRFSPMGKDSQRSVAVIRHPTASFADIIAGTSTDGVDLSQYAAQVKHTSKDCDVTFRYHTGLDGSAQPQPGELLELQLAGQPIFVGVIDTISAYNFKSGEHSIAVKAYSRDNTPTWKDVKRVTDIYVTGTPVNKIANDIAVALGLTPREIALPAVNIYTVHSNLQLANMAATEMLSGLFISSGYQPFVSAIGILKAISRSLSRPADVVLDEEHILEIKGSKSKSPTTSVRIRWLDPNLQKVSQQDQPLANATITAGFFQLVQKQDVYWSNDRTQRAENTYLVVQQSANAGLLPVCTERYSQINPMQGRIELDTAFWAPTLATAGLAGLIAASFIPDGVGVVLTIPAGRLVEMASQVAVLLVMMSIGTGIYEVRGSPYDYVHARNTTEADAFGVPAWLLKNTDIENDFVMNENQAQAFAARELIYLSRSAAVYGVTIVDDPRIEPGDLVELYDGSRLYVLDYTRDLSSGAAAKLELVGFQASLPIAASPILISGSPSLIPGSPSPIPGLGPTLPSPTPVLGPSPSPGAIPPPALAAGLTVRTGGPNVALGLNVHDWNFLGNTEPPGANVQNSDGSLTCTGHSGNGYSGGVCTAYHSTVGSPPHSWRGNAYSGDWYVEAVAKYPAFTGSVGVGGWPSLWGLDIEFLSGDTAWFQWPGQATGYGERVEPDVFEFDYGFRNKIGNNVHHWYRDPLFSQLDVHPSFGPVTVTADLSQYQAYGLRKISATSTTRGSLTWYFNNVAINTVSWDLYNPANPPPPVPGTTAWSLIDVRHIAWILGSSNPALPITTKSLTVWQSSTAGNLTQ